MLALIMDLQHLSEVVDPYPLVSRTVQDELNRRDPHLVGIEEEELLKEFTPSLNDRLLRQNFWKEYIRAMNSDSEEKKMYMNKVFGGVLSKETFTTKVITNHKRLTYMVTPPKGYTLMMSNLLDIALDRFYEILNLPVKKKNGDTDTVVVNAIIKAGSMIREAIYGQAVQRNINVSAEVQNPELLKSAEDIDKKILELKTRLDQKAIEIKVDDESGS